MNEPDVAHETPFPTALDNLDSLQRPDAAAPADAGQTDGWNAYYERLKRQQKLTKAIEADNAIHAYLTGSECRFDDETFRRCDEWAKERFGFETSRGDALNGHDLRPFENAAEYARTVLDVIRRGTEAVVTPEYVEAIKAKAMGDDALDAYLGIDHGKRLQTSGQVQSVTGAPAMKAVDRTPDEIAQERNEKFGRIMAKNFIAVYNAFNDKFAFTPTEDRIIASAVRSRDGLKEREMQDEFARLAYDEPERAANILELIRRTKKDEYGFMRDAFFEISESWGGTFKGLVREAGEFGSKARMEIGYKRVLNESGGQYYWNDAEKALFARLNEDFNAKPKRGMYGGWEHTLARDRQMRPLEFVNWQCAGRLAREAMPQEERNNRRKAELMLEEASRHAPIDHGLFYKAVVGGVSTIPYMAESAAGPIGFAAIALNQFGNVRDQIIMEGGDPDEAIGMQLVLATGWAAVERLEFAHLFGKPLTNLSRRAVLMNIADTSWKNGRLGAIGKAVRTIGPEYAMTLLAENAEEGLQGAIERGTVTAFTTHDWKKTVGDAVTQFGKDFVDATPTMVGLTGIGAGLKYRHAKKYAYDTDSLADFAAKYVRSVNIFRDTCAAPAASRAAGEQAVGEWKQKAAKDMWFDACSIWRKHIDDRSGAVAALEEIREKYNLNDEQARQVGEAMDLRENLGQLAGADEDAEAVISGSAIRGAFRIGSDTTYDPVDLMRAVNPDIRIETVAIPGATGEQTDEMKALVARQTAAKAKADAAKVGSARKGAERELRRINRKIAQLRRAGREFVGTERKKVTIPLQNGETRSYFIEENGAGADINAPGFAQAAADAMREVAGKTVDGKTYTDGQALSLGQFASLSTEEKLNVAVTREQYLAMTDDERKSYCKANALASGGDFRLLDEQNRVVYSSDGVVEMMRAFGKIGSRPGGNWTLAHEHGHAVVAFAKEIGQLPADSARVNVLRRIFGDPTGANELWNEERMMNGFADYLRNEYDFRRQTDEERRAAKGVFGRLFDTIRGIFAAKGERMPDTASQKAAREQAMDAAFEAIRKGDFAGLDSFAGVDVGDASKSRTEDAPKPPDTPSAEKAGKDTQTTVRRDPASPAPAPAPSKEKAAVPEPDDEAYKAGFAAALAQISENPDAFAANLPVRTGTKRTVFTPGYEMRIEADAMWTPLDSLAESTDDREVQMRDRDRVATGQQVLSKSRKGVFQPLALFPGSKSDDGAPIVGGGLRIISGHGRKRMLQLLAEEGRYAEYLDATNAECERQGMPTAPEGMKNPVLVLRVTGGLEKREDLTRFAELSNRWGGLFWDLTHRKSKGTDLRRLAVGNSMAPWDTEDIPAKKQIVADERASTTDVSGKKASRHSVRRGKAMNREDYATALFAARRLAGKEVSPEDADKVLKHLGVSGLTEADALARANQLAEKNRSALVGYVERGEPEMVSVLAAAGMRDRFTSAIDQAITGGASAADPSIGAKVARLIQAKETRDLMAARGFTAADMMAKLPISLANAIFAVAEYEKSPEELARLERLKKEQEARRAAELEDEDALSESIDDPTYTAPTAEQKRYYEELMDRARFKEEARKAEADRKRLEKRRKAEETASADSEDDADGGTGDADAIQPLPADTVRRIAPIFEDSDQFAAFLVEWVADETCKKHPNIPNTAEMWKNPVAIRELKQTATHILRQLAKDVLGSPSLNYARNFADHAINGLESDAEAKTFNAVRRKIARIYDQIHNNALAISRRQMVNKLVREIKTAAIERGRMSTTKEDLDRKIDAKTERWCRWVVPALTMSEAKLQVEIDRLTQMVTVDPDAKDAKSVSEDKLREAADRLAILHKYGGMIRWMPGKIADAEKEIMDMVNGRRAEFERRRAERDEKNALIKTAIVAAMEAGKPATFRGEKWKFTKWMESMQGDIALEMQNLLRHCPDPELRRKADMAIDELRVIISEGGSLYNTTLCRAQRELAEGIKACYGSTETGIRHLTAEKIPDDAAQRLFRQKAGKKPTFGQLLQLYATTIQADYKENAEAHGRTADIPLMEATLTDGDRKFHAWAVEWFKANRQSLSDVVEDVTGLPVTSPDGLYTPAKIEDDPEGIPARVVAWSPVPNQLTRRVKHGRDFRESANFFSVLNEQCEVRARTIGYARAGIALRDTIASRDVREAAKRFVGADDMARVVNHLRDILVQDSVEEADHFMDPVNIARKWTARFGISWNVSSILAQPASLPVFANVMLGGRRIGLAAVARYLTDVDMTAVRELSEDMGFRARYEMGWSEDVKNILQNPSKNRFLRYVEKVYYKGLALPNAIDRLCSLWVAQGFYRDATAHFVERGDTLDEAKRKARALTIAAVESTQQTSRIENMNALQRKKGVAGSIARGFFQFKTAQLLSNNFVIQAAREVAANPKDRKAWGKLVRTLFISTVVIPSYMAAKSALWNLLMGEEPEPEDDGKTPLWFRELLYGAFDGVTAPIFFVAQVAETPLKRLFGLPTYGKSTGMPAIESAIRIIGNSYKTIEDAFLVEDELKWDAVKADLDRIFRQAAAPYRQVRKAIENRTDD